MSSCPHSTRWESALGNVASSKCVAIIVGFNDDVWPPLQGAATDMETKNQELSRAVEELSKLVKDTGEGIAQRGFPVYQNNVTHKVKRGFLLTFSKGATSIFTLLAVIDYW